MYHSIVHGAAQLVHIDDLGEDAAHELLIADAPRSVAVEVVEQLPAVVKHKAYFLDPSFFRILDLPVGRSNRAKKGDK
jgi:hypothetical protein